MTDKIHSHTPGPWSVDTEDFNTHYIKSEDYGTITLIHDDRTLVRETGRQEELEANAHLIAAAPELLKALAELIDALMTSPTSLTRKELSAIHTGREAIAKAEGTQ